MLSGHPPAQEIKHESLPVVLLDLKSSILSGLSLSPGPKSSLVPPCKISHGQNILLTTTKYK